MAVERVPMTQVRQGDVLLTPQPGVSAEQQATAIRTGRDLLDGNDHAVLAVGLGGGHPHIVTGDVRGFIETNASWALRQQPGDPISRVLMVGPGGAELEHDEHESIYLPPGSVYIVFRQLETLVGDENNPSQHAPTGIIANDRVHNQQSRRYVED